MDFKSKFSKNPTVNISVVQLNDRRLTKSVFNQLQYGPSYLPEFNNAIDNFWNDVNLIGYVKEKSEWLIYEYQSRLYRSNLELLLSFIHSTTLEQVDSFLELHIDFDEYFYKDSYSTLPKEKIHEIERCKNIARLHYTIIKNHQIYL